MKKSFDDIDRSDFVDAGYAEIRTYFERAVAELNDIRVALT